MAYCSPLILEALARNLKMYFGEIVGQAKLTISNFLPASFFIKINGFRTKLQNWVGTIRFSVQIEIFTKLSLIHVKKETQRFSWLERRGCVLHSYIYIYIKLENTLVVSPGYLPIRQKGGLNPHFNILDKFLFPGDGIF